MSEIAVQTRLLLCSLLMGIISCTSLFAQVKFTETDLVAAQKQIVKHSLPYIIYFSGSWCPSCQLMEESTFQNSKLADQIKANYLAFKVDVDSKKGRNWMKKYAITCLPTTLFFDENQKLVERIESPITSQRFIALTNPIHVDNLAMNVPTKKLDHSVKTKKDQKNIANQVTIQTPPAESPNVNVQPQQTKHSQKTNLLDRNKAILSHLKLSPPNRNGQQYIVQIGKYENVRNVERLVQTIQKKYDYPIKVLVENKSGRPLQTVYLGEFKTKQAALAANENLKWINRKGIVKKF